MLLTVEKLTLSFEGKIVVNQLSFAVEKGKVLGIVGESGSGKSLTALSIMGLLPKEASLTGTILLNTPQPVYLNSLSDKEFQKLRGKTVSMIFQDPLSAFNNSQKIGEQLTEAIKIHHKTLSKKEAKAIVLDNLAKVHLNPPERFFDAYPFQMSGGQRQRALIAMALLNNPSLIIADEPTTALDVTVQKEIVELLKELIRNENLSMIFISHDLGLVAHLADDILVLYKGETMDYGSRESVLFNPVSAYTKALLMCKPTLSQPRVPLPEVSDFFNQTIPGKSIPDFKPKEKTSTRELLKVEGVSVEYKTGGSRRKILAVKDLSLTLFEGETLGLVGESGCGKTTLSRTLLNLINPTSGSVIIDQYPLKELGKNRKKLSRIIQIVFQDPYSSLNPVASIGYTLNETIRLHHPQLSSKERRATTLEWLSKVGLNASYMNRRPKELSGGECQRVAIARALIPQPKILICDEAVSALDVSVQAKVLNLLNYFKREFNLTYLFISHDLSVVRYMADRIVVMKNGEFVEEGQSDAVFSNPENDYTRKLIDGVFELPKSI